LYYQSTEEKIQTERITSLAFSLKDHSTLQSPCMLLVQERNGWNTGGKKMKIKR